MTICVECYADYVFIKFLTKCGKKALIHSGGKSRVVFDLVNTYEDSCGLVDEDLGTPDPRIMGRFDQISIIDPTLEVRYHKKRNNSVIIIKPKLEAWILDLCKKEKIDLREYGLPNSFNRLHRVINFRLDKFRKLLNDLDDTESIRRIKSLIPADSY